MQDPSSPFSFMHVIDFHPRSNRSTLTFLLRLKLLHLELHVPLSVSSENRSSFFFFISTKLQFDFLSIPRLNMYRYASVLRFNWERVRTSLDLTFLFPLYSSSGQSREKSWKHDFCLITRFLYSFFFFVLRENDRRSKSPWQAIFFSVVAGEVFWDGFLFLFFPFFQ